MLSSQIGPTKNLIYNCYRCGSSFKKYDDLFHCSNLDCAAHFVQHISIADDQNIFYAYQIDNYYINGYQLKGWSRLWIIDQYASPLIEIEFINLNLSKSDLGLNDIFNKLKTLSFYS